MCLSLLVSLMPQNEQMPLIAIRPHGLRSDDCRLPPVLFCNRAGTEVAAAHAGWRGLCAGVLEETVSCFADNPENILARLGPAIGPRAFEVGAEVREAFMVVDAKSSTAFIQHGDKYLADIYQLARSVWRALVLNKFLAVTVVHIRKMRLSSLIVATRPPVVWQVSFG